MLGAKRASALARTLLIIEGFNRSRLADHKYEVALREAVDFVRRKAPQLKVSTAEVKRVLREYQSEKKSDAPTNMEIVRMGRSWIFRGPTPKR